MHSFPFSFFNKEPSSFDVKLAQKEEKMNQIQRIKNKRQQIAKLLGDHCVLCLRKFGKNFHFHHIGYRDNEKKHSDFKSWSDYNNYVLPIIEKIPEKFSLLCNTCHRLVSILQAIKDDSRFERVVDLARRSRK